MQTHKSRHQKSSGERGVIFSESALSERAVSSKFLLKFAPENLGAVERFRLFECESLSQDKTFRRGIATTADHLQKFSVLAEIANEISKKLDLDREELDRTGYTPGTYSNRYAAVIECCINELYSSLDGIRDVVYAAFKGVKGIQKKSTEKTFRNAAEDNYGEGFPEALSEILKKANDDWFYILRRYRTEFTHGSLGSCHKDPEDNKISYMHRGLGKDNKALVIDDIVKYINAVYEECLQLQAEIFEFFYDYLTLKPTKTLCGIYKGLVYMREVSPERPLTFHSGVCISKQYEVECPLKDKCGAYAKAVD